jgi:hypothetical protein
MRARIADLGLAALLALYLASLAGILFVSHSAVLLGFVAFALTFLVGVFQHGFQRQPIRLKRLWVVVGPAFAVLFITGALLTGATGGPETGDLPIFATREKYVFLRHGEVSRFRFVAAGCCFYLAWHALAMAFAGEQWAALRNRINRRLTE